MWLITNNSNITPQKTNSSNNFNFFTKGKFLTDFSGSLVIYCEGHVMPLIGDSTYLSGEELIKNLYLKHGSEFINKVKGNFIIIIVDGDKFFVYSDRFAIKKFFYWQSEGKFILSSDISLITKNVKVKASSQSFAVYAITYHFTGGTTHFENVKHNTPSELIEFNGKTLLSHIYWNPIILLKLPKKTVLITEISKTLNDSIEGILQQINNNRISLSLTGGADTRNLLAMFLKKGLTPHLYTYGNPDSKDCKLAAKIAKSTRMVHNIYDIKINPMTFESYARKIIRLGSGLASIHRVHRIMAAENEKQFADWMFLGTLGGEFIKGVSEDDYIDPSLVYENWHTQDFSLNLLQKSLQKKFIKSDGVNTELLLEFIRKEPYMVGSWIERKINSLSFITAHLHDAQDINLYNTVMEDVFTPFLDVDYLEILFSSVFSFDNKERIRNKYIQRLNNPVYSSMFLKETYPILLNFHYAGAHKPSEVLINRYYAAILKMIRQKTRHKYPANFPLDTWMKEFVAKHLPICYEYQILRETFDLKGLMEEFSGNKHIPTEAYWLKFTNPIMMRFGIEELQSK